MKIVLFIFVGLSLAAIIALFVLSLMSQSGEASGLVDGKLTKCPAKPNCIGSEFEADASHFIEPLVIPQGTASEVLQILQNSVREMGGNIQVENSNYLAATFTSAVFRFVDDLEIRIDRDRKIIHLRSASRVGNSDLGVNKKRIERLKSLYNMQIK